MQELTITIARLDDRIELRIGSTSPIWAVILTPYSPFFVRQIMNEFISLTCKVKNGSGGELGVLGYKHRVLTNLESGEIQKTQESELDQSEQILNLYLCQSVKDIILSTAIHLMILFVWILIARKKFYISAERRLALSILHSIDGIKE